MHAGPHSFGAALLPTSPSIYLLLQQVCITVDLLCPSLVLDATPGCLQALRQRVDSAVIVNPQQLQVFPSSLGEAPGASNAVWKALEVSGEFVDRLAAQLLQSSSDRHRTVHGARAVRRAV